jgi:hypothetical protein
MAGATLPLLLPAYCLFPIAYCLLPIAYCSPLVNPSSPPLHQPLTTQGEDMCITARRCGRDWGLGASERAAVSSGHGAHT